MNPCRQVSQALGCRPTMVKADKRCACARDRFFWCDFEIIPAFDEWLWRGPHYNELVLPWSARDLRLNILDEGWEFQPP